MLPSLQIPAKQHLTIVLGAVRVMCELTAIVVAVFVLLTVAAFGSSPLRFRSQAAINASNPQSSTARPTPSLTPETPVKDEIKGGETDLFRVQLKAGDFVSFRVEQHGIILEAALVDPHGVQLIQMDGPAGGYGPILLSAIAEHSGDYRFELKASDGWALVHPYEVFIDELRPKGPRDELQAAAEKAFSEGRKHWKAGEATAAIRSYEAAKKYWDNTNNYHWRAVIPYTLSEVFRNSDNVKSGAYLKETLSIPDSRLPPSDWRLKASALNDLGAIYARLGAASVEEATTLLKQAFELYRSHNDRRGQASSLGHLATIKFRAGNLSAARDMVNQALEFRRTENDKPGISNAINMLAVIADGLGEPEDALKYSRESLQNWEALGEIKASDRRRFASVLSTVAVASDKLGQWDQAFEYYDRALAVYNETDPLRAVVLDNKGELYVVLGNPAKARECYEQALKILSTAGNPDVDVKAGVLVHLGQLSIASGDVQSAIKVFQEALSLQPPVARQADILTNLANSFAINADFERAMATYSSTLKLQKDRRDQRGQALTLQKRGEAYALLSKPEEALNDLNSALPLWRAVKDQRGEAATLNAIARVEQARGNFSSALAHNSEAIRIVESLRTNISSYQLRTTYFSIQENYYELDVDLRMQLSKVEKRDEYVAAALESSEKARARVLLDSLNEAGVGRSGNSKTSDPRFSSLIEEKLKLLSNLAAKAQARTRFLNGPHSNEQIATLDRELTALNGKYDEVETRIRSQNPRFATLTKPSPARLRLIQKQLDDDALLIEFLLGEHRSYAWIVGNNSLDGVELPAGPEIEQLARRISISLSERGRIEKNESPSRRQERISLAESDFRDASSSLSKALLVPLARFLTKKRLVVVADGALQLLPFGALPYPEQLDRAGVADRMLLESHEIVTLPSASVILVQRQEFAGRKPAPYVVAVIADPVFGKNDPRVFAARSKRSKASGDGKSPETDSAGDESRHATNNEALLTRALVDVGIDSVTEIARLPFSLREAKAILKTVPASQSFSALDFDANRATVMNPKLAQYRIVHLATHGVMDLKHPELSGILLSMIDENGKEQNGYLGLNEIYNLNWPSELVVLSACETGIGKEIKGEGLIALTRGFMYAGAARVVASLWKVNDRATAVLMEEFYHEMLVNKSTPAAALRAAQLKLSRHPRWRNPHFWAGFVLQGEWR